MRKHFLRYPALMCIAAILLTGASFAAFSLEERERESYDPYTFGDIAAARFAVYGILGDEYRTPNSAAGAPLSRPEAVLLLWKTFGHEEDPAGRTPFTDVGDEYADAVSWAYTNGIARGCSDSLFGTYPVTEQAFVTMLLNALGYRGQFAYAEAFSFAQAAGLSRPVGLSNRFSLGDAALYLQQALEMTLPGGISMRVRMNIPLHMEDAPEREQAAFPASVILYPVSWEDAQTQIELATHYLPSTIQIRLDNWSAEGLFELYRQYVADAKAGNVWYVNRILDEYAIQPYVKLRDYELTEEQTQLLLEAMRALDGKLAGGYLTRQEYDDETVVARIQNHFSELESLSLLIHYNEAWKLACDVDDAFLCYKDETVSRQADMFYHQFVAGALDARDAVFKAKNAIVRKACYADALRYADGWAVYSSDAHSITGFFKDGRIVCDGYAKVFQYLMHRAGVPCAVVFGSTMSKEAAENRIMDHAWNKVFVNDKWLNMDICWADTGWPDTFDLKSNDYYADCKHWLITHSALK